MIGRTISHYKITDKLGEGGMGVVYQADDTKLDRAVALKFLPTHLLGNEDVRKRFEREAKAAAALHHPNICPVYEIDEVEGRVFISMAFIEGESLDKKIARSPLKLDEALDIAGQIANGLEAAHKKGIFHRDIKPENVIVDDAGHVTIMDFGLAQLTEASRLTRKDETMGTVGYMSPEQTEGSGTDHRTDIWSLGVVIYEMVTGQQPFKGDYDKAVMYSILNEEPEPITALRTGVPIELEMAVGKCLAKKVSDRYQSAAELIIDLRKPAARIDSGRSTLMSTTRERSGDQSSADGEAGSLAVKRRLRLAWAVSAGLALIALGLAFAVLSRQQPERPVRRFSISPPEQLSGEYGERQRYVAVSPDGRFIAFVAGADRRLWVHEFDRGQSRVLEGTEDVGGPFWSPDSEVIAFHVAGELRRIPVRGGTASRVCQIPDWTGRPFSGSWSADGEVIVFSSGSVLHEVPARGGDPRELLTLQDFPSCAEQGTAGLHDLSFLPPQAGSRILLFTCGPIRKDEMIVQDLESGRREFLGPGTRPSYAESGHVVFKSAPLIHDLWAVPFSVRKLAITGARFPVAERVRSPSVAEDGTLVYVDSVDEGRRRFVWLDRSGQHIESIDSPEEGINYGVLSPDNRSIAVVAGDEANLDIWVQDVASGARMPLTTTPEREIRPAWSPDGREIAFTSARRGAYDIFIQAANGSGEAELVADSGDGDRLISWSRDGQYILYLVGEREIRYAKQGADGGGWSEHPFLEVEGRFRRGYALSPNGRFFAYSSAESGREQIYVTPFPEAGSKHPLPSREGKWPRWSPDGKELFFVEGGQLMAVPVSTTGNFSAVPEPLFEHPSLNAPGPSPLYDVGADGKRFLMVESVGGGGELASPTIRVVLNWHEESRDRKQDLSY